MPALQVILWLVLLFGTVSSLTQTADEYTCSTNCTCCINKTCIEDDVCEKDCEPGFQGINCTETCPSGCLTCPRMFSENSTCFACKAGLYGDTCHLSCSRGCQDSKCDQGTGVCSDGCADDYTGDKCCTKGSNCSKCSTPSQCEVCDGNFTGDTCELCKNGYHGDMCNKECINCKGNTCNKKSGKCTKGCYGNFKRKDGVCERCKPGYWSPQCDKECPLHCVKNKCRPKYGTCYNCKVGLYGIFCNITCPTNCKNQTCIQKIGTCLDGCRENFAGEKCETCVAGRYGENCESDCNNCKGNICSKATGKCIGECSGNFTGENCDECIDGIYGMACTKQCPRYCRDRACDRITGNCLSGCINNTISGDKCCLQHKQGRCKTCSSSFSCSNCETGYYGSACADSCSEGCYGRECDKDTGKCSKICTYRYTGDRCCVKGGVCKVCKTNTICEECGDEYYGEICDKRCPGQCADGKCDRSNGSCLSECAIDHFGVRCSQRCPHNCKNKICDKIDGTCRSGCETDYYGTYCNQSCPPHCKYHLCDKVNGTCVLGCDPNTYSGDKCCLSRGYCKHCSTAASCAVCENGFYDEQCHQLCSRHCNRAVCSRQNGKCHAGCHDGYTGDMCCLKDGHCQNCKSVSECEKCKNGYFGAYCNDTCPPGCLGNICDKITGVCSDGCKTGLRGDKCCQENGFCEICKSNDECEVCEAGYFGKACFDTCSAWCRQGKCERNTGECQCKNGFSGDKCCVNNNNCRICSSTSQCARCMNGFYGNTCEQVCPSGCSPRICNKQHGTCNACRWGYYGSFCNMTCPEQCKDSRCHLNGSCSACNRGYYKTDCTLRCPENCANDECRMDGVCLRCINGFHGQDCSKSCSSTCLNKFCYRTGTCLKCEDGFYGSLCKNKCQENCLTCASETQCDKCKPGFHGNDCRYNCPSKCKTCKYGSHCDLCEVGYYGYTCNKMCSFCKSGTTCRKTDGYCLQACKAGHTSDRCRTKCNSNCKTCERYGSRCITCNEGRFGDWHPWYKAYYSYCLKQCSENCLHGLCDDRTGHCLNCTRNFKGDFCDKCREPLANPDTKCKCRTDVCVDESSSSCSSCINSTWYPHAPSRSCCPCSEKQEWCEKCYVDHDKKFICEKCKSGFYPTKYQCTQCPDHCLLGNCDSTNGRCTDGCEEGHWGPKCDNSCRPNCNDAICDRKKGHCTAGCISGHWGETCDKSCGQFCVNRTCDRSSGHCVEGCEKGHWGDTCNGSCVNHCEVCINNAECVRCAAGRYLTNCSERCSRGCAIVKGFLLCNINDGSCRNGCSNERVYGRQCDLDCSANCTGSECEWITGECRRGCVTGLYGEFCNNTCADTCIPVQHGPTCYDTNGTCIVGCLDGYYGDTCRDECSRNCVNGTCDRDSGSCLFGCLPGHRGANCLKALSATGPDDNVLSLAVPVIVALLLVALLAAVVVAVIRKSRHTQSLKTGHHVPRDNDATLHDEPVPLVNLDHAATNDDEVVYANTAGPCTRIPVAGLLDYVVNMTREDYAQIYQTLPKGLIKPYQDSQKPESVSRNRYKTIYPYDFSRVKLEEGNDYINASFIDGYRRQNEYIASLGPLARTTENFAIFWQMIWEQNVEKIVMLTNLQEPSGMKCEQYWADAGTTVNYDVISVYGRNDDVYADYVIRHLMVTKGDETREVYHLHYIAWPDKTIPDDVISLLDFRHVTSSLPTKLGGPMVVHCSAGIGRTGTYMGLDILCKQTEQEVSVDVYGCVMTMRENRVGMVQTTEQYMFLHRALAVYVTLGYQPIRSECFSEYVSILDDERLQRMFADLEACRKLIDIETAAIDRNRQIGTNRACADIPGDKYRVRIRLERQHGASSDYVNAVYLNSHAATNRYIVAQTPVQGGEEDFLALLLQERCSAIIDLDPVTSSDDGWMSQSDNKRRSKVNNFHTSCSLMTAGQKFSQRQLRLSLERQTTVKELNVSLYQFKEWEKDASVPESPEDFVGFIRGVESAYRKFPENGPILLHCGSAGGRSCLFYVVAMAIQRIETEHEVGVLSTVHQTRARRRGAIPNKEQLLFCYQCVDAYLQSYETYSNFVA